MNEGIDCRLMQAYTDLLLRMAKKYLIKNFQENAFSLFRPYLKALSKYANGYRSQRPVRRYGNALMEYVVPAGVLLLSAGVLVTAGDAASVLGEYFMSASGYTSANLSDGVFKTDGLATNANADIGNGRQGFSQFAVMMDGNLEPTGESAPGAFYLGDYNRAADRETSSDPEYLFP